MNKTLILVRFFRIRKSNYNIPKYDIKDQKNFFQIFAMSLLVTVKTAPQRRRHPLSGGYRAFGRTFYPNQGLKK